MFSYSVNYFPKQTFHMEKDSWDLFHQMFNMQPEIYIIRFLSLILTLFSHFLNDFTFKHCLKILILKKCQVAICFLGQALEIGGLQNVFLSHV